MKHIDDYGSPLNFDAGAGERGLKEWAKKFAKTVQFRGQNTYNTQIANRVFEASIIQKALIFSKNDGTMFVPPTIESSEESIEHDVSIKLNRFCFQYSWSIENNRVECVPNQKLSSNSNLIPFVHPLVHQHFDKKFQEMTQDEAISSKFRCYVEMKKGNISFKARPKFRGDKPWYITGPEINLECIILFFLAKSQDFLPLFTQNLV